MSKPTPAEIAKFVPEEVNWPYALVEQGFGDEYEGPGGEAGEPGEPDLDMPGDMDMPKPGEEEGGDYDEEGGGKTVSLDEAALEVVLRYVADYDPGEDEEGKVLEVERLMKYLCEKSEEGPISVEDVEEIIGDVDQDDEMGEDPEHSEKVSVAPMSDGGEADLAGDYEGEMKNENY